LLLLLLQVGDRLLGLLQLLLQEVDGALHALHVFVEFLRKTRTTVCSGIGSSKRETVT
jgi:hypothetical protein